MLRLKYGVTVQNYNALYEKQKGCCAICNLPHPLLQIDHCHTTNHIRGLLCGNCNRGLGMFRDSVVRLQRAFNYLNQSTLL